MRYEIRPLGEWLGPITDSRHSSGRFKAAWSSTLDLLGRETEMLGATLVVIQVDVTDGELRRDGMLRANAKVGFPGVRVSFDSRYGPLTYATDAYEQRYHADPAGWQANVRAIALALEALRAVDRYGVTSSGEQYVGWQAIGATAAEPPMTAVLAQKLIDSYGGHRAAKRATHPDAGGDAEQFRRVMEACRILGL